MVLGDLISRAVETKRFLTCGQTKSQNSTPAMAASTNKTPTAKTASMAQERLFFSGAVGANPTMALGAVGALAGVAGAVGTLGAGGAINSGSTILMSGFGSGGWTGGGFSEGSSISIVEDGMTVIAPQTVQRPFFPAALSGAATSVP